MNNRYQYDVFLSHNQADKPRVRRLAERLRVAGFILAREVRQDGVGLSALTLRCGKLPDSG